MNRDDKITMGILGSSFVAAILLALMTLLFQGCRTLKCYDPIVHPTDEQIRNGTQGGQTKDPPYVPWWAGG